MIREIESVAARHYLRQLEVLLQSADPDTRSEVMAGVVEHLQEAEMQGEQAVHTAISQLGAPEQIALAATEHTPGPSERGVVSAIGVWAVAGILIVTLGLVGLLAAGLAVTSHFEDDADWNLSPLLTFVIVVVAATGAAVGLLLAWTHRAWPLRSRLVLTVATVGAFVLLMVAYSVALSADAGWGFLIAPLCLVVTAALVALVARLAFRASIN